MEQADGRGPARRRTWRVERVRSGWGRPVSGRSFSLSSTFHVGILLLLAPLDGARPVGAAPRRSVQVVVRPPAPEPRPVFEDVVETVVVPSLDDVVPEAELERLPPDPEPPWLAEEEPLLPVPLPGVHELLDDPAMARMRVAREPEPTPPEEPAKSAAPTPTDMAGEAQPTLLEAPPPVYPRLAQRMSWEGTVVCRIRIGRQGDVLAVAVERSSGHDILDDAACEALRRWRFRPGLRAGQASEWDVLHRVVFRLNG